MNDARYNIPTVFIVFGGTGDLAERKLLPSLFNLYRTGNLPDKFSVIGFAKTRQSQTQYRRFVGKSIRAKYQKATSADIRNFLQSVRYTKGNFNDPSNYESLSKTLETVDGHMGQCSNKLFYLAIPPKYYRTVLGNLSHSGLTIPCSDEMGWTRVLIEKPFGKDMHTAQELDDLLARLFREEQIFRIDHYLAKETVQNILSFRFANTLFETIWNNNFVEKIEIRLREKLGVEQRGNFYDGVGALRDVGQNHMLQMLALITMDHPITMTPERIRQERTKILRALRLFPKTTPRRGQYATYPKEEGVEAGSQTETYFKLVAEVDSRRWRGVPIYLESGKGLAKKETEIIVTLRPTEHCFCPSQQTYQNKISLRIAPKEGINVRFLVKQPGFTNDIEPKDLSFSYKENTQRTKVDAYEKVLYDCVRGDQTLFANTDEVAAAWAFITPILSQWKSMPLEIYKKGSAGPK